MRDPYNCLRSFEKAFSLQLFIATNSVGFHGPLIGGGTFAVIGWYWPNVGMSREGCVTNLIGWAAFSQAGFQTHGKGKVPSPITWPILEVLAPLRALMLSETVQVKTTTAVP